MRKLGGLRVIGWGPFSLPGERRLLRRADAKVEAILSELAAVRERAARAEPSIVPPARRGGGVGRRGGVSRSTIVTAMAAALATSTPVLAASGDAVEADEATSDELDNLEKAHRALQQWSEMLDDLSARPVNEEEPRTAEKEESERAPRTPRGSDGASIQGAE